MHHEDKRKHIFSCVEKKKSKKIEPLNIASKMSEHVSNNVSCVFLWKKDL